jgi:hypothetical protein
MRTCQESTTKWASHYGIHSSNIQECFDGLATLYENPNGDLGDHPGWYIVSGNTDVMTYEDMGTTINTIVHDTKETVYSKERHRVKEFTLSARVYGTAESNDWDFPITANYDNGNMIGIRRSNGKVGIAKRQNGHWSEVHDFGILPEDGTILTLVFDNGEVTAGIPSHDLWFTTTVNFTEAYPSIRTHTRTYDGIFASHYQYDKYAVKFTQTPNMTGAQSPYGITRASNAIDGYPAWEGMNYTVSANNAWLTDVIAIEDIPENGHYMEWKLRPQDLETMPMMIPVAFEITPRGISNSDWFLKHNPQGLLVYGIRGDDSLVEIFRKDDMNDWGDGNKRTFQITTNELCKGFRLHITKTNNSEAGIDYHSGFSKLIMYGKYKEEN